MTASLTPFADGIALHQGVSWWDSETECTLVISRPSIDLDLWDEYAQGARHSYRNHGVEAALDEEALSTGSDTVLFFAAVDLGGQMVAGVRAIGPLQSADHSHALVEWRNQPGEQAVRKMITDRVPFGILEMKTAWVSDAADRNRSLTKVLARSGFHMMALLDTHFCMATAAAYVLNRWRTSGGVVAPIPATPYPDERYQTKMMWWDRKTFAEHAEPDQVSKILTETTHLLHQAYRTAQTGPENPKQADALVV